MYLRRGLLGMLVFPKSRNRRSQPSKAVRRKRRKSTGSRVGAFALLVVLVGSIALGALTYSSFATVDNSYYPWGQTYGISGGQAAVSFNTDTIALDLRADVLQTSSFQVTFQTLDNKSFNSFLFWSRGGFTYLSGNPSYFSNGTWNRTGQRTADWSLPTPPEKGVTPWEWQLTPGAWGGGEYPWESYELIFIFGFNRTLNVAEVTSYVTGSSAISDLWKVHQQFLPLGPNVPSELANHEGSNQYPILTSFHDYYMLKISFIHSFSDVLRGTLAFWVPSLFLLGLLIVAYGKRNVLETSEGLTLFVGIGMGSLPFIIGALQLLPPRLSFVEIAFYAEIAASTVFAAMILNKKRAENR